MPKQGEILTDLLSVTMFPKMQELLNSEKTLVMDSGADSGNSSENKKTNHYIHGKAFFAPTLCEVFKIEIGSNVPILQLSWLPLTQR